MTSVYMWKCFYMKENHGKMHHYFVVIAMHAVIPAEVVWGDMCNYEYCVSKDQTDRAKYRKKISLIIVSRLVQIL